MKPIILAAAALATLVAVPAAADPKKGNNGRGNSEQHERWDRDDRRGGDDRGDYRRDARGDDRGGRARAIPPGHMPPPGACRVWIDNRPPGHQPSVTSCREAQRDARRYGGRVIYGGRR